MSLVATTSEASRNRFMDPKMRDAVTEQTRTGVNYTHGARSFSVTLCMSNVHNKSYHGTGFDLSKVHVYVIDHNGFQAHQVTSVAKMIQFIRATFGLNIKQLAGALQITRVTVYEWLKLESGSGLKEESRRRLNNVYQIAKVWRGMQPIAGNYLQEFIEPLGKTLEELLQESNLDTNQFFIANSALLKSATHEQRQQGDLKRQRASLAKAGDFIETTAASLGVLID